MVDLCHRHFDFSLEQQPKKTQSVPRRRSRRSFRVSLLEATKPRNSQHGRILPPRLQAIPDSKPGRLLRMLRYGFV